MLWPNILQYADVGMFFLRLAVGIIFIVHALPKLKNPKAMAAGMGKPNMAWFPAVLGVVELLSALGLIFGVYIQLAALLLAFVMLGAMYFKMFKWSTPFSAQDKMGWEFDFLLFVSSVLILVSGGGAIWIFFG
jgi:uncharacterized membrane protein YphA (DoxX/SURF4 family)